MTTDLIDHESVAPLIKLIDTAKDSKELWGLAVIKRDYLYAVTKEAFLLSIKPMLMNTEEAHVYFSGKTTVCVAWRGKQKRIFQDLQGYIATTLVRPEYTVNPSKIVSYHDLHTQGGAIREVLVAGKQIQDNIGLESAFPDSLDASDLEHIQSTDNEELVLKISKEQIDHFQETRSQKPFRKHLHMLVAEDQHFSQKLLCEILRGVRVPNSNESPTIEVTESIQDAWAMFVKNAPDITFIDLVLLDGSGHTLARAIKEVDPQSRVVIVTANSHEGEIEVARQNNVDSFITKPYNKKQILDCATNYMATVRNFQKRATYGKAH